VFKDIVAVATVQGYIDTQSKLLQVNSYIPFLELLPVNVYRTNNKSFPALTRYESWPKN